MADLTIDLWSDVVCPWCWIGKHRIEKALADSGLTAEFRFHAFELGPRQQKRESTIEHLASKYHVSLAEARAMTARVQALGAELGIDINPDVQKTAPTFDAHRLVRAAQLQGRGAVLMERLHRAHFSEGLDVGDKAVLKALAVEIGLDASEAERVLSTDAYAREVEQDEARAGEHEITGVPFAAVNMRYGVAGAQSVEAFQQVFNEALKGA